MEKIPVKKTAEISDIPIGSVFPNPNQPRKAFDTGKLEELSMSVRHYGVLEPIVVTPRNGKFMIIAGERRFRASLMAELSKIPARVIEADDALVEELALLENVQRQDLNPIEEGMAYKSLLDRGWSLRELADKLGYKKIGPIEDRLSLLRLMPEYRAMVVNGKLNPAQAYELSRLPAPAQPDICAKILSGKLGDPKKLYALVTAMLNLMSQGTAFALTPLTPAEAASVGAFESLIASVERAIKGLRTADGYRHLEKAAVHTGITSERISLIIAELQKIRRAVHAGEGARDAKEMQTA